MIGIELNYNSIKVINIRITFPITIKTTNRTQIARILFLRLIKFKISSPHKINNIDAEKSNERSVSTTIPPILTVKQIRFDSMHLIRPNSSCHRPCERPSTSSFCISNALFRFKNSFVANKMENNTYDIHPSMGLSSLR